VDGADGPPAPLSPETVTALDAAARDLAEGGLVRLADVVAQLGVTVRALQKWRAQGLYALPAGLVWRGVAVGPWTDRVVVDAYLARGRTVRGLAAALGCSRGTAHARLRAVTDPAERARAGLDGA
jgi:hypothetical protein